MNGQNTIVEMPATPEQVLGVLQDYQQIDCASEEIVAFDSTVHDWLSYLDVWAGGQFFGKFLNEVFDLRISDLEWKAALLPEKKKTLKDVCDFVAERVL